MICNNCKRPVGDCGAMHSQECWKTRAEMLQAQLDQQPHEMVDRVLDASDDETRLQELEGRFGASARAYREAYLEAHHKTMLPLCYSVRAENLGFLLIMARRALKPVPILMECPMCKTKHIDEDEFATKKHHTHACQGFVIDNGKRRRCGHVWRPAIVATVGVEALPGFINEEPHAEH